MYRHLFFSGILLLLVLAACKNQQALRLGQQLQTRTAVPPNGVRIGDNLFMDESEVSNLDYREYLYWTAGIFGRNSPQYLSALPDTLVWKDSLPLMAHPLIERYFRDVSFEAYPVVGVTLEQARRYSDWRTDRVYERILMQLGKINPNAQQDPTHYFTVAHYQSGRYLEGPPDQSVPVPRYRLPLESEWEIAAAAGLDVSQYPQGYNFASYNPRVTNRKGHHFLNTKKDATSSVPMSDEVPGQPAPCKSFTPNDFGIYHLIGNVAEMTAQPGLAKGGHYLLPDEKCTVTEKIPYQKPSKWLGFRNICSWEKN